VITPAPRYQPLSFLRNETSEFVIEISVGLNRRADEWFRHLPHKFCVAH